MTTRFRLSSNGNQHHLMIDSTPEAIAPVRGLARMDGFALSLVLNESDTQRLRTAIQDQDVTTLKAQLADATNACKQAKAAKETLKIVADDLRTANRRAAERTHADKTAQADKERTSAKTIGAQAQEITRLNEMIQRERTLTGTAQHDCDMYQRELGRHKTRFAQLHEKHQVLSDGYQRLIDQSTKLVATSRPRFSFDTAMSSELERLRKDLKAALSQRDAAQANAAASTVAYQALLTRWEART
ncbi:hypothetical protein [Streptomyces sp. H27-C3]|uniref:hypothetical protein n=1 Tax=Streptomyces sp. H27-C3 TaxID=3046305 RepID=UPI0024B8CA3E|nr:hypothetical protein [Streptomyces sp. H27-C3]MDJ0463174.1 hypothetical protein [Streptomyces sp. H27-C3]